MYIAALHVYMCVNYGNVRVIIKNMRIFHLVSFPPASALGQTHPTKLEFCTNAQVLYTLAGMVSVQDHV